MTHDPLCAKAPTGIHYVGTCTCKLIAKVRAEIHDPLCPLTPPTADYEPYLAEAVRAIQQETPCQCDLIAKVRADERLAVPAGRGMPTWFDRHNQ